VLRPTLIEQSQREPRVKSCALDSVGLTPLMELTSGGAQIAVGLIDGPVVKDHPDLVSDHIREVAGKFRSACTRLDSAACRHGTFVAGILSAKRSSSAPAICPGCTLLVRPIFSELTPANGGMPTANPEELAEAILDCVNAGAHVLNISAAIAQPSSKSERILAEALDHAARRGAVIVAAAGNQATMSSTIITGHPWVIPIAACDLRGKPLNESNLGHSIGRHGLLAPGEQITSLGSEGQPLTLGGTSAAAPFATGAIALVWSQFPSASGAKLHWAFLHAYARARSNVTPPLLNAWAAYQTLLATHSRR
jgi:subtilisin family serine protease